MKMRLNRRVIPLVLALLAATHTATAFACAVCYGKSDAPMAKGMNWGIMVLLAIVGIVLSGVAGFFVYLAKRPALLPGTPAAEPLEPPTRKA